MHCLWPRQRENISVKTLMVLKPRIFSPANLSRLWYAKTNILIQSFGTIYQHHTNNIIMYTFGRITETKIKFHTKNNTRMCVCLMLSSSVLYNAHHVQSLSNVTHNES